MTNLPVDHHDYKISSIVFIADENIVKYEDLPNGLNMAVIEYPY
jgi:hypothetical protein